MDSYGGRRTHANGDLYCDGDHELAQRILAEDVDEIKDKLTQRPWTTYVILAAMLGTTNDMDGLAARALVIFGMLRYRLKRLLVTSIDKLVVGTLHVADKPYIQPSTAVAFGRAVDGAVTSTAHCMNRLTQRSQDSKVWRLRIVLQK